MDTTQQLTRVFVALVALAVVIGALAPGIALAQDDGPPEPPHRVYGHVTDDGDPVAGATVEVTHDGAVVADDTANDDGYYDVEIDADAVGDGGAFTVSVEESPATLEWESAASDELDFDIAGDDTVVARGSGDIDRDDGSATIPLSGGDGSAVTLDFAADASGRVGVSERDAPADADEIGDGTAAVYFDIEVPDSVADSEADIELAVGRDAVEDANIDPEDLEIAHFDGEAWEYLDTEFEERGGDIAFLATTPGFSDFALATQDDGEDGSDDDEGDDGDGGDDTEDDSDGGDPEGGDGDDDGDDSDEGNDGGGDAGNAGGGAGDGDDTEGDDGEDETETSDDETDAEETTENDEPDATDDATEADDGNEEDATDDATESRTAETTADGQATESSDGGIPGFGVNAAVAALLAALLAARRADE